MEAAFLPTKHEAHPCFGHTCTYVFPLLNLSSPAEYYSLICALFLQEHFGGKRNGVCLFIHPRVTRTATLFTNQ